MTESIKKLINKEVYEKNAIRPWAKIADFVFSEDGKMVEFAILSTVSLIPVFYEVGILDFKKSGDRLLLKEGVKPKAIDNKKHHSLEFGMLKNKAFYSTGKRLKIRDVCYDTEIGEITDFIAAPLPVGRKTYFQPESEEIEILIYEKIKKGR